MSAMTDVIKGIGVAEADRSIRQYIAIAREVVAANIIDEPVVVVINPVEVARVDATIVIEILTWIDPDVGRDVRVFVIEPGIDDCNDLSGTSSHLPCLEGTDPFEAPEIRIGLRPAPCAREKGIVRVEVQSVSMVPLDEGDMGVSPEFADRDLEVGVMGDLDSIDMSEAAGVLENRSRLDEWIR